MSVFADVLTTIYAYWVLQTLTFSFYRPSQDVLSMNVIEALDGVYYRIIKAKTLTHILARQGW